MHTQHEASMHKRGRTVQRIVEEQPVIHDLVEQSHYGHKYNENGRPIAPGQECVVWPALGLLTLVSLRLGCLAQTTTKGLRCNF